MHKKQEQQQELDQDKKQKMLDEHRCILSNSRKVRSRRRRSFAAEYRFSHVLFIKN